MNHFLIYALITIVSLVFFSLIFLWTKYYNIKSLYRINEKNLEELESELNSLRNEKENLLKENERLSTSLKMHEEYKEESFKNSKSILYDLSNSMVNQLIDVHKKEVNEARKHSEEKISQTTETFNSELRKVSELVGSLNKEVEQSKNLVDNLKNALLSPSSSGMMAEITLENLLKNSGLKKEIDFLLQYSFAGDDINRFRPDAVIFLPEDNILIIDAKSSQFFTHEKDKYELAKSMNLHLKNLITKDYTSELSNYFAKTGKEFKRVCTVMFIPTEHALEKIVDMDPNFIKKAWQHNIYPAGPSGLMNILSISRVHISEKLRIDNYEHIIYEINNLINSVATLSEHAYKVGSNLVSAVNNYDKFAGSFNRNLISKIKNLKLLGTGEETKKSKMLERYQIVTSKNELIEAKGDYQENEHDQNLISQHANAKNRDNQ